MASESPVTRHVPVLADEVMHWLDPQPGQRIVDGTLGGGGHARLLAQRVGNNGRVIALDRDPAAVERAQASLQGLPIELVRANFCDLPEVLGELGISEVDGVLLDLGLSSDQLADADRGFSFDSEGPLDMRFDPEQGEPAWRLVNKLSERRLADLIYQYGEERHSRRIARRIVEARRSEPIRSARRLAGLVRESVPRARKGVLSRSERRRREPIDPATRTFQALRIAVNDEIGSLERALQRIPDCLRIGGRLAVISFHSLEDRPVKTAIRDDPRLRVLTRRPVRPTEAEIEANPRSRSARLRVAERIEFK
jgi:16S rRNA (cytosine1402-N4)-methyltransferase